MSTRLSKDQIAALLDPKTSKEAKVEIGGLVAETLRGKQYTQTALGLAQDILRLLAVDLEVSVRRTIAEQIADWPYLNEELSALMVRDVDEVALPILENAHTLAESLLIEIVSEGSPAKGVAIAGRRDLNSNIASAIIKSANVKAVISLIRNQAAPLSEANYSEVLMQYGQLELIHKALLDRDALPFVVVHRLASLISGHLFELLATKYEEFRPELVQVFEKARAVADITFIRHVAPAREDPLSLARQLHITGELTPTLLFLAIVSGDIEFYISALAIRAGIGRGSAEKLAFDAGVRGHIELLRAGGIGSRLHIIFKIAMETWLNYGPSSLGAYQSRVVTRLFEESAVAEDRVLDNIISTALVAGRNDPKPPWALIESLETRNVGVGKKN